jgi:acyloxyacyl hydrolase
MFEFFFNFSAKKVNSIYMRMKERNRCNHRDYQNICVNGARTGSLASKISKTMQRNKDKDHPAILFYAFV